PPMAPVSKADHWPLNTDHPSPSHSSFAILISSFGTRLHLVICFASPRGAHRFAAASGWLTRSARLSRLAIPPAAPSPHLPVSLSPCLLVSLSPCLLVSHSVPASLHHSNLGGLGAL